MFEPILAQTPPHIHMRTGNIMFVVMDQWMLMDIETPVGNMTVIKGVISNVETHMLPQPYDAMSGEVEYFDYEARECRAGNVFYKLANPHPDWLAAFIHDGSSADEIKMGYRTHG